MSAKLKGPVATACSMARDAPYDNRNDIADLGSHFIDNGAETNQEMA